MLKILIFHGIPYILYLRLTKNHECLSIMKDSDAPVNKEMFINNEDQFIPGH